MKRASLFAGLVLLCAGSLYGDAPSGVRGGTYRYCRGVQVAAPGWVRIRLSDTMLARMGPGAEDFVIRGPGGGILPAFPWKEPQTPPPAIRVAEMKNMETVSGGWRVEGDLGPGAQKHRLLMVDLPGTGLAEDVYLEGSPDGARWHSLARGSMFRLSRWGLTSKTYLEYAPTRDRYIRLFWPTSAGFPSWRAIWVADWSEGSTETVEDPLPFTPVWKTDNEAAFRLSGPRSSIEQGSVVLDLPLPYPVRARLMAGQDGAWHTLSETICYPDRAAVLSVPPDAFSGPAMLVLNAGGFVIPSLAGVNLRSVPRSLLFRAEGPGNYTFCYGATGQSPPAAVASLLPTMPTAWTEGAWGPETESPLPALPAPSLAAGAALPPCPFQRSWRLEAPQAKAGDLVVVELPAGAYAATRTDLGDVRLAAGDHQVPYILWSPPEGTVAASLGSVTPKANSEGGTSVLELDLPATRLPLTVLDLAAPATPFTREVTLQVQEERAEEGTGRKRSQWTLSG